MGAFVRSRCLRRTGELVERIASTRSCDQLLAGTQSVQAAAVAAMPLFQRSELQFIFVSQAEMYLANRGTEYYESVGPTPIRMSPRERS